jgi:predicted alpha/beta superfamily hydrolase
MTLRIKAVSCLLSLLCLVYKPTSAQVIDSTELPGAKRLTMVSKVLNEKRTIRIYTPADMDSFSAYPVLYVLDGEAQSVLAAGQVKYLSESYKIIPNLIVVGIDNTDRMRDLTPTHTDIGPDGKLDTSANSPFKKTGGGERFLQFIKTELMPFIETRYHTAPYKILAGHSLGALMAVHCLVSYPDYFNAYIAISPSLQWDSNALLKQMARTPLTNEKHLLFFSDANEDTAFHQNQLTLDSLLKSKAATTLQFKRNYYPEESHISEPVKAFYDGIRFVYPAWHLPYNSSSFRKTVTAALIKAHYVKLAEHYGYNVVPLHDELMQIGRFLRIDPKRVKDAVELLIYATENYPSSAVAWETLGDTYVKAGDQAKAVESYRRGLLLAPNNAGLQRKINQ